MLPIHLVTLSKIRTALTLKSYLSFLLIFAVVAAASSASSVSSASSASSDHCHAQNAEQGCGKSKCLTYEEDTFRIRVQTIKTKNISVSMAIGRFFSRQTWQVKWV
jgi:hypothetical protein